MFLERSFKIWSIKLLSSLIESPTVCVLCHPKLIVKSCWKTGLRNCVRWLCSTVTFFTNRCRKKRLRPFWPLDTLTIILSKTIWGEKPVLNPPKKKTDLLLGGFHHQPAVKLSWCNTKLPRHMWFTQRPHPLCCTQHMFKFRQNVLISWLKVNPVKQPRGRQ